MKILITYVSFSGVTKKVALKLKEMLKADEEEIIPLQAYTSKDLDWNDKYSRSSLEMNNEKSRPNFHPLKLNPLDYDIIFVGYPIWWYVEPRLIDSFFDHYDLKNKIIIPFATSGGSGIAGSLTHLRNLYPSLNIKEGLLLNDYINENKIRALMQ